MKDEERGYAKNSAEFKRWLALYFIQKGYYKITDKAIDVFGTDEIPRQFMEFTEQFSSRERDDRLEYRKESTRRDMKNTAMERISLMIDEGKAEELYDGYIVNGRLSWNDKDVRLVVVRKLVEILDINDIDLLFKHFIENALRGLIYYYENSPYKAVKEAFPEKKIQPWEMITTPKKFYKKKENRIAATKWLVSKLKKDPRDLRLEDFGSNRLGGLLHNYYNDSPYKAVKEAFPEKEVQPWEMIVTPQKFYKKKENRVAAVKWLVKKLVKDPRNLTNEDFIGNKLRGLIDYYNGSPYKAVKEAGLVTEADKCYIHQRGSRMAHVAPSSKEVLEAARKIERKAEKKTAKAKQKLIR